MFSLFVTTIFKSRHDIVKFSLLQFFKICFISLSHGELRQPKNVKKNDGSYWQNYMRLKCTQILK